MSKVCFTISITSIASCKLQPCIEIKDCPRSDSVLDAAILVLISLISITSITRITAKKDLNVLLTQIPALLAVAYIITSITSIATLQHLATYKDSQDVQHCWVSHLRLSRRPYFQLVTIGNYSAISCSYSCATHTHNKHPIYYCLLVYCIFRTFHTTRLLLEFTMRAIMQHSLWYPSNTRDRWPGCIYGKLTVFQALGLVQRGVGPVKWNNIAVPLLARPFR